MLTWHIHIAGQVQGVGFRPFVYTLAKQFGLKGWVNNTLDGVHIEFNATEEVASAFADQVLKQAPRLSRITSIHQDQIKTTLFDSFQIIHSKEEGDPNLLLTPDFALCDDCRKELRDPEDRRRQYPFITCTNCGPRYAIVQQLPYDREHTVMDAFQMCHSCRQEYTDPKDRRYFSQTNSCPNCGIDLAFYDAQGSLLSNQAHDIIDQVVAYWQTGKIVAVKGIGGYLLTCDAAQPQVIQELRRRKHRPSKPFALMYPKLDALAGWSLSKEEATELSSPVAPIVLLHHSDNLPERERIATGLQRIGVMLPYAPLFELLLEAFAKPIIATSGNASHSPIIYKDEQALQRLSSIADGIVTHNRQIVVPQDDSVVQFSLFEKERIILRRSRGLAPTFIPSQLALSSQSILAVGAMLKSTFAFLHRHNTYISQYLGDLEHFDAQNNFQHTVRHFLSLLGAQPEVILCDQHPAYPSSQWAAQLSHTWRIPMYAVQHHLAHFAAIIGEHNLVSSKEPILGVIWDGTGLGADGQIWGGEFFTYEEHSFFRCHHFDYFDFILGDKMPREPRVSALSVCWSVGGAAEFLREKFTHTEWSIYNQLLEKENSLKTSSVGRLFDAVASLLGVMDRQTYEGEAAMRLEALATSYITRFGWPFSQGYFSHASQIDHLSSRFLMAQILMDLRMGKVKALIAAKFHFSLVEIIRMVANDLEIKKLAFSGGVFQNSLLVDLLVHHLSADFQLHFHQQLPPNDENVSFGQLVYYQIAQQKEIITNNKSTNHVFSDTR